MSDEPKPMPVKLHILEPICQMKSHEARMTEAEARLILSGWLRRPHQYLEDRARAVLEELAAMKKPKLDKAE
jgi:hypothetical protein